MHTPPTGTVTFLFTDIEGSTHHWETSPEAMRAALAQHDRLLRRAMTENGGHVFKTVGDAFCVAFATAPEALASALAAQNALTAEPWATETPLRVRMALHTGSAQERDGDYFGPPLNRVARLLATGYGGQTLLSLAAQELTRDTLRASMSLRDLGPHRLKDLGRPETVFQLLHPSLPAEFPPLRSLDSPALPNNLPQQSTSFIGREKEFEEVKALLGKSRLLTLTGAGGSGKTRLSLQVASELLDGEGDGVWFVELAALADPALVPQAVAQALGVREAAGKTVRQCLVEYLQTKHLLLVLDNCEHLVAACASLVADLLRSCPNVHVLTTSREPLNVAGEQTYRVPSLSLPDPKQTQTAEGLSQYEAVRLFIERAQAVQPTFSVTDQNAPAVAQVCFHLDGIPLAIELAAARVRSLPVEEINKRLDQRFRLLTGGARNTLPRQQTLRALIDWSYDLLAEAEKALLCRLSVFAGGWTLAAAEAVCAGEGVEDWEVLDLLTSLVDKSLAAYEEPSDGGRYRLLETVRQYAGERLGERGEIEAVRDGHLAWCVALAEEAVPWFRCPEQGRWLARLATEHDNLRAGLTWAEASSGGAAHGLKLAGALGHFWYVRGHWPEAVERLTAALAREGTGGRTRERARALRHLGSLADLQQSLEIYRENGDRDGEAASLHQLAWQTWGSREFEAARELFLRSLAINRELGDRSSEAENLNGLGTLEQARGDPEAARTCYEQGVEASREVGDQNGEAKNMHQLGWLASNRGDFGAATPYFERSLVICRDNGNRRGEGDNLQGLAMLSHRQGDSATALELIEQSMALFRELGAENDEAAILRNLAYVRQSQGDWGAARTCLTRSLEIARRTGERVNEVQVLDQLGVVAREQGDLAQARAFFAESLALKGLLYEPGSILATLEEWAALSITEGDALRSARLAGAAQAGREAISAPLLAEQRDTHERTLSAAHAMLGDAAFTAAWHEGRAMTLGQAVEFALGEE